MKTWLVTPSFCKADLLEDFLKYHYPAGPPSTFGLNSHVIIDNHYPVDKEKNRRKIQELSKDYGCIYVDSGKDLGLHGGLNNMIKNVGISPHDFLIGHDADDRSTPGFFEHIENVMNADPNFAVIALNFGVINQRIKEQPSMFDIQIIGGESVAVHKSVEMFTVAGFNMKFIHDCGGFNQHWGYYGGLEACMFPQWAKRNLKLGYLLNYRSDVVHLDRANPKFFDPQYREWKTAHLGGFTGSFEQWLEINTPELIHG